MSWASYVTHPIRQVAKNAMDNQLLRYSAKDHFFRAAICTMCVDTQDACNAIARYEEMFPTFSDARECKLIKVYFCISISFNNPNCSKIFIPTWWQHHIFSVSMMSSYFQKLIDSVEEQNVDSFSDAIREYDSISRLDQWYTTMLLRIKKTIEGEPDLR